MVATTENNFLHSLGLRDKTNDIKVQAQMKGSSTINKDGRRDFYQLEKYSREKEEALVKAQEK